MAILNPLPFVFVNGTTIDATQVNADFAQIIANANANAAHSGANSDITSLTGITTPLTELQGGTGGTSMPAQGGGKALLATGAIAGGLVAFTGFVNARYTIYEIEFTDLIAATNGATLGLQISEDSGSSYQGGTGYGYVNTLNTVGVGVTALNSAGADRFDIGRIPVNNGGNFTVGGKIRLYKPSEAPQNHNFSWESSGINSSGAAAAAQGGGGFMADTNAYNAVRLLMSAGNITSVKAYLYGLRIT